MDPLTSTAETSSDPNASRAASREEYYRRIGRHHMAPLWERLKAMMTPEPRVASVPHLWNYDALRPMILEAAALISAEEAERRVLVLENPGLAGESAITESLYAGLQLIMPGEVAPAHRHSPSALRFIIEGHGAYTAVDGEKAVMEPGDFIVTPAWTWHDHGHEGSEPVVWMDVLDVPIIRSIGVIFTEHYPHSRYPERAPPLDSLYRYGTNMLPVSYERKSHVSPIFSYPYSRSREALERLKDHTEWDPCHGLKMEYIDPTTGGAAMPTISTFIQLLPKGFATQPYRSTEGSIFCVVEGRGRVHVTKGDQVSTFEYQPRDVFAVPCWCSYRIEAREESVLFSASDRVLQAKLGVWREQRG